MVRRSPLLALLAVVVLVVPATAQDGATPKGSPEPSASPGVEVPELGGAWRRARPGPFGAADLPGGWTGTELVVADAGGKRRAAAYIPALDTWYDIARPPRKIRAGSEAYWTGTELLFVEPFGAARRGLSAYDPLRDDWRRTARSPINEIASSAWASGVLVVASSLGRTAALDVATETWTELAAIPLPLPTADPPAAEGFSLRSTGAQVFALITDDELAFVPLDLERGQWGQPSVAPFSGFASDPLWAGEAFMFLTPPDDGSVSPSAGPATSPTASVLPSAEVQPTPGASPPAAGAVGAELEVSPTSGRYDPAAGTWDVIADPCGVDSSEAVWTGSLVLDVDRSVALDPVSGQCYTLPLSPWAERSHALRIWTGSELIDLSGVRDDQRVRRDGVAYSPVPDEGALGVAVDKPSRPVRVRVPSLGIDLPVISDERRVAGSTPGYPACDVALEWSFFDRPGKPGTAWLLAHAQEGMFLPLLTTLRSEGKEGLLGRRVEVQLRDGRLLTYLTYRVNPRATNVNIGLKGRKAGEHRLVLQTSTGIGSAPKLLVAARLVDVGTTDEPRPRPQPRACG